MEHGPFFFICQSFGATAGEGENALLLALHSSQGLQYGK